MFNGIKHAKEWISDFEREQNAMKSHTTSPTEQEIVARGRSSNRIWNPRPSIPTGEAMTDLSKQLAEIKRRNVEETTLYPGLSASEHPLGQHTREVAFLLSIIEVEIPGMLRAEASGLRKAAVLGSGSTIAKVRFAAEKIEAQATAIESLTKDNANG